MAQRSGFRSFQHLKIMKLIKSDKPTWVNGVQTTNDPNRFDALQ
jgi:hypothetical protein